MASSGGEMGINRGRHVSILEDLLFKLKVDRLIHQSVTLIPVITARSVAAYRSQLIAIYANHNFAKEL